MINIDIARTLNNSETVSKSTKNNKSIKSEVEKTKPIEVKEQKSFSEFLGEKVSKNEVTKNPIKEQGVTEEINNSEVLEVITEKLENIITKIEEGLDGEAIEMLSQLLQFLNIPVSNLNDSIKELVNKDLGEFVIARDNAGLVIDKLFEGNMVNNILLEESVNSSSYNKEGKNALINKIIEILNLNSDDTNMKLVERLENSLNKILPLLHKEGGKDIKIDNIIAAIKEKLNSVSSSDISNENLSEVNSKKGTIDYLRGNLNNSASKQEFTSDNNGSLNTLNLKELDEDSVLSKILGEDVKDFSGVLSKLQGKTATINSISQEGTQILKESFNTDVIKNVKFMVRNAVTELNVKIYPKELGEITIKILSEEGIMRAEIKATSKETYNLLNSNMNELKKSLSNESIRIHDVNIGLYSEDATYFSGRNSKEDSDSNNYKKVTSINGISQDEETEAQQNIDNSNLNLLA